MEAPSLTRKKRYAKILLLALVLLFLVGIIGFTILEEVSVIEAMYLTIGTLTTVAPFDLHDEGRLFAMILIMVGFGLIAATAAFIGNIFMDVNGLALYRRRKVQKKIDKMSGHYIICGHGQIGQIVAAKLHSHGKDIVVLERDEHSASRCREEGITYLTEDATEESTLMSAGIERAHSLISLVNRDADNVFIVVTARALNQDIFISARANSQGVEKKLYHAGANHVVSPYASAAVRIIQNMLRPTVSDFLGSAIDDKKELSLEMEEILVPESAPFAGKALMDSSIRNEFDLIVVAIKRKDGTPVFNPSSLEPINVGDTLITIGPQANIDLLLSKLNIKKTEHA
ncbi:potassium channel family protein [Salidesulfovibrio brasiliensis]|uniref:potassium channel family protein n=1 Tax=Salidesulfovibrio brasiliensis TaxID=221711 RepID=UPI0009F819D9|nr:potassium channel protein [Salidesulfovibrio brasiliensis]